MSTTNAAMARRSRHTARAENTSVATEVRGKLVLRDKRDRLPKDRAACSGIQLAVIWDVESLLNPVRYTPQLHVAPAL